MASYFVACSPAFGEAAVHDRSRCPPGTFPQEAAEYLGEFFDAGQALAVARLRYAHATRCGCCTVPAVTVTRPLLVPSLLRS